MDPARLYESPYTDLSLLGVEGLFASAAGCCPVNRPTRSAIHHAWLDNKLFPL
jgi:hypothetical protein